LRAISTGRKERRIFVMAAIEKFDSEEPGTEEASLGI
jgi:hypothetical protein